MYLTVIPDLDSPWTAVGLAVGFNVDNCASCACASNAEVVDGVVVDADNGMETAAPRVESKHKENAKLLARSQSLNILALGKQSELQAGVQLNEHSSSKPIKRIKWAR
jgi:hypothetical protein